MQRNGRVELKTSLRCLLAVMGLLLASCASYHPVESNYDAIRTEIKPGDLVEVRLSSGEEISIEVTEIRETEISGDTNTSVVRGEIVTVPLADIEEVVLVDREYGKAVRTTETTLGVIGILGIILFIAIF